MMLLKLNRIFLFNNLKITQKLTRNSTRLFTTSSLKRQSQAGVEENDKPVKYSTSKAKDYDPINSFSNPHGRTQPTAQPFIVVGCFLVLFFYAILREPNSIDDKLSTPLEHHVPGIKIITLKKQIAQYEQLGMDTKELRKALDYEIDRVNKVK